MLTRVKYGKYCQNKLLLFMFSNLCMRFWRPLTFRDIFYLDKPVVADLYRRYLAGSTEHANVPDIQPG